MSIVKQTPLSNQTSMLVNAELTNRRKIRFATSLGGCAILLFMAVFGIWSVFIPIASAIPAEGYLVARGKNMLIKHPDGGVVKSIETKEGDVVDVGQVLVTLDETEAKVRLDQLEIKIATGLATAARLVAQRDGKESVIYPPSLVERRNDSFVEDVIANSAKEFRFSRESFLASQTEKLRKIDALKEEILGLEMQRKAAKEQLELTRSEFSAIGELLEKELTTRDRVFSLRRTIMELEGKVGNLQSTIASKNQTVAELEASLARSASERFFEAASELEEVRRENLEIIREIVSATNTLNMSTIVAPVSGKVVRLEINTITGVVEPAQTIAEILPANNELLVDVRVVPTDIEAIHPGQRARVKLTALGGMRAPTVDGVVEFVSPDRLTDENSGENYYTVRVHELAIPNSENTSFLYPGMPVEVFLLKEERNFVTYLLRPIFDGFERAFAHD